jgi:hypothetical protein
LLQRAWGGPERVALALERRYQRMVIGRKNQRQALAASQAKQPTSTTNGFAARRIES